MDILDPDLASRIGSLSGADAEGITREACALFVAGHGRREARDLARALHWLLSGRPRACPSADMVHAVSGGALSPAQCTALAFALDLMHEAGRGARRDERPGRPVPADLDELLALGGRLALALELTRRSDYFLSEMYSREEILIG